jgi:hypothetical protein
MKNSLDFKLFSGSLKKIKKMSKEIFRLNFDEIEKLLEGSQNSLSNQKYLFEKLNLFVNSFFKDMDYYYYSLEIFMKQQFYLWENNRKDLNFQITEKENLLVDLKFLLREKDICLSSLKNELNFHKLIDPKFPKVEENNLSNHKNKKSKELEEDISEKNKLKEILKIFSSKVEELKKIQNPLFLKNSISSQEKVC